jgi:RNA-splicing ligase RtcB
MENNVKIFAGIIEDEAIMQIESFNKVYNTEKIRIMPDVHAGKGCTIGTTIKLKDKVTPNMVGVDIGCGMLCCELGNIDLDLSKVDKVINDNIPAGFNIHEKNDGFLKNEYFKNNLICYDAINIDRVSKSLGTLGGGNHFIEIDVDDNNNKYLIIHTGSRNLGVGVCNYYQNIAIKNNGDKFNVRRELINRLISENRQQDIQSELQKLTYDSVSNDLAYLEGKDFDNYMHDMFFT